MIPGHDSPEYISDWNDLLRGNDGKNGDFDCLWLVNNFIKVLIPLAASSIRLYEGLSKYFLPYICVA